MVSRFFLLLGLLTVAPLPLMAQTAIFVRIERAAPDDFLGSVVVTVNGTDCAIARNAIDAWIIENGRAVVYSGTDGAGGFENEGQSLWRYDIATGRQRKLMTELFAIYKVVEARTQCGETVLLVSMRDGGLGAPHAAVVHPTRGQVWRQQAARFVGVRNGRIAVGIWTIRDFEREEEPKPRRMQYFDLDRLLARAASPDWPVSLPQRPMP